MDFKSKICSVYFFFFVNKKSIWLKCSSIETSGLLTCNDRKKLILFLTFFNLVIVNFLTSQPSKFLTSLFLVFAYFFSALSISEVFEDYIDDEKIKNAAIKTLNIVAISIPLITIIIIFNLGLWVNTTL